jgi:cob(I)alamin adenosyltransferase
MKIYTKSGDKGETSLFGGGRVSKSADRIEAYGTVDELNAVIGQARAFGATTVTEEKLRQIQDDLFVLGADLATPESTKVSVTRIGNDHSERLERWIDELEVSLEPLRSFILPGGNTCAATLHIARTVARRAERRVITAKVNESISEHCVVYLNRLSDFLFVLSRYENHQTGFSEQKWPS